MSESVRMWVEISFNLAYLIVIWGLVIAMWRHRSSVARADRRVADLFLWAFALLALGDTGHVGFRVLAYALGSLETEIFILGTQLGLVGLGALATAVTVTLFYVLMLEVWRARFHKPYGWFGYLLLGAAVARLLLMLPATNEWNNVVPPQPWSIIRYLLLMLQGFSEVIKALSRILGMSGPPAGGSADSAPSEEGTNAHPADHRPRESHGG